MGKKLNLAILTALKNNQFIAEEPIHVKSKGPKVILVGTVSSAELIFEAIATAESVHPLVEVYSKLTVVEETEASQQSTSLAETTAV